MLPSASADTATVRAWFESHFQPYQIFNENGTDTGTYTGYYSPIIPACRKQTAQCNEPLMAVPNDGRNYKGVPKKVYDGLLAAESKGKYMCAEIKGKYEYEKLA
jgi:membrane-bound lytic murein transglycosylase